MTWLPCQRHNDDHDYDDDEDSSGKGAGGNCVVHAPCIVMHVWRGFAKTNHFTFALIEAVVFALAVHYSFVFGAVSVAVIFRAFILFRMFTL